MHAAYHVRETCTSSDGRYLTAGQQVTLPVSVGDDNAHLERVDAEPTTVALSISRETRPKRDRRPRVG